MTFNTNTTSVRVKGNSIDAYVAGKLKLIESVAYPYTVSEWAERQALFCAELKQVLPVHPKHAPAWMSFTHWACCTLMIAGLGRGLAWPCGDGAT